MATTTTEINLPDIQATPDQRATAIAAVGIRGLELPLHLDAGDGRLQSTLGTWDLAVSLAEGVRGTHMSRFVELASQFSAEDSAAVAREMPRTSSSGTGRLTGVGSWCPRGRLWRGIREPAPLPTRPRNPRSSNSVIGFPTLLPSGVFDNGGPVAVSRCRS